MADEFWNKPVCLVCNKRIESPLDANWTLGSVYFHTLCYPRWPSFHRYRTGPDIEARYQLNGTIGEERARIIDRMVRPMEYKTLFFIGVPIFTLFIMLFLDTARIWPDILIWILGALGFLFCFAIALDLHNFIVQIRQYAQTND